MANNEELPAYAWPVPKAVNLIPVGLKEAAWDSPSFRASASHLGDQADMVEKWLEGCAKAAGKLAAESSTLETLVNTFLSSILWPQNLSEAIVDPDYSLTAAKRFSEAARDSWISNVGEFRKLESLIVEPIRNFLQNNVRAFKESRRTLEQSQKVFDQLQMRYSAQAKTKEPSSLREDAFQLHEARKIYLKASMDFSVAAPQFRIALDKMLTKVFADESQVVRVSRDKNAAALIKWVGELERIRNWSKELEQGEKAFRRELLSAKIQIEDAAEIAARPSRELEDYAIASSLKGPSNSLTVPRSSPAEGGRQGWLNMKTVSGKPARPVWIRRWFYVRNGVFGWLVQGSRSGGVEESDRIGVLLCGLRSATLEERRFCFELKTKDITIVLQADSQTDLMEWMVAFDMAKQKALEDPASVGRSTPSISVSGNLDLAFAISPPSAPEFAASAADAGLISEDNHDRTTSVSLNLPPAPTHRGSFDVTATNRLSNMEGESGKVNSPQIGSQTGTPNLSSTSPPVGGIASLISASHMTLPLAPGVIPQRPALEAVKAPNGPTTKVTLNSLLRSLPASSLAPSALANPPNPTNLSGTAVMVNGERSVGLGQTELMGGTPSGILANSWGSLNWSFDNKLENRDTAKKPSAANLPAAARELSEEDGQSTFTEFSERPREDRLHRKTVSLDGNVGDLQRAIVIAQEFPSAYPSLLKYHDAQFRLLFPSIKQQDKLVLLFRATWNPNDQQDFPGRVYVTSHDFCFYSNHLGLVLTTRLNMTTVSEITAAPGRECDFLFLHLKLSEKVEHTRITIKTFLEPLKLLQRRLNFLVENANANEPQPLEVVMKTMTNIEHPEEEGERSPSIDSYDEALELNGNAQRSTSERGFKDLRARLRVDQSLLGTRAREAEKNGLKFKLPSRPVNYIPLGMMNPVAERVFHVSPKALFHILFGDRGAIWQLLYHARGAQDVKQGPWSQLEEGHMQRIFTYTLWDGNVQGQADVPKFSDSQTVDVLSDHLCYVVTDRRTYSHLPYFERFNLISKIVITHVAKSRCKLAIYTKVEWSKKLIFFQPLIERRALFELQVEAFDLFDVVAEQVRRLAPQGQTKKAVQIFGSLGQETQTIEFKSSGHSLASRRKDVTRRETVYLLLATAVGSSVKGAVNIILAEIITVCEWVSRILDAHLLFICLLIVSVLINAFLSSGYFIAWWQEHRARQYMKDLGIGNELVMSRSITLGAIDQAIFLADDPSSNVCYRTFNQGIVIGTPPSTAPAGKRLRQTRQHLGVYRHDLLVAMRLLNTIEQEMVHAEWEHWVATEIEKCAEAEKLLKASNSTGSTDATAEGLRSRLLQYCATCEVAALDTQ